MDGENKKSSIEQDDAKMEELLDLQSYVEDTKPPEYDSLEEKYEESLMLDQITKMVEQKFSEGNMKKFFSDEE